MHRELYARHCCSIIITEPDENVDSSDLGDPKKRKVPANESCRRLSLKGSSLRKCVLESINEEEQIFTKKQQSHGRAYTTKLAKVQGIKCFKRALSGSSKLQQNLPRSLHH